MAGRRLPERILRHTVTLTDLTTGPATADPTMWIEGEPNDGAEETTDGVPFSAIVFLPQTNEADGAALSWRPRAVTRPLMLFNLTRRDGSQVIVTKESTMRIEAVDLAPVTGAEICRWQVDGIVQPFGPPGRVFAAQAIIKQVID